MARAKGPMMWIRLRTSRLGTAAGYFVTTLMLASSLGFATPLTNVAHLDFLTDVITPPEQEGHTTYRMAAEPSLVVLWTYAEPIDTDAGSNAYRWVGGGEYDASTDTWGQGAYNTDDW